MYIQLTETCNMACDHCCFAATSKRSPQMDRATYMQALQVAIQYGEFITIGGGEPTIHKDVIEYVKKAAEFYQRGSLESPAHMVTNGKLKGKVMKLLDMVDNGLALEIELSIDKFHDPIDMEVYHRFERGQRQQKQSRFLHGYDEGLGSIGIRTVHTIMPVGRANTTGVANLAPSADACCCETPFVDPIGDVWSCGCKIHKLGTIWDDNILDGYCSDFAHQGGYDPKVGKGGYREAA